MNDCKGHYGIGAGWFLVGSVLGACAALLLAPASGKSTRERLARKVRDTRDSVTEFTDELADGTRQFAERASRISDKTARLAEDASATARGVIGALGASAERAAKRQ